MGAASRIGYAISTVWQHLIPFRILDRAGKIRGAPRDAIVADISIQQTRGKNFGLMRMADHMGAVVGILICLAFFKLIGYRNLFMLAAIPSFLSALLIFLKVKETKQSDKVIYKGMSFRDMDRNFVLFMILSGIFAIGNFTYSFLLIHAKQSGFQIAFVPVLYLVYTIAASLTAYPFGRLADKIGRKTVMQISFFLWGLVCLVVLFFDTRLMIFLMFILYGLHKGAIEPVQSAIVSELAPIKYRASSLGAYQMLIGLCAFPASMVAGLLWDIISFRAPFYLSLGLTILAGMMMLFVREPRTE